MPTILHSSPLPSPFVDDPYRRIGGIHKNCLLAPYDERRYPSPFRLPSSKSVPNSYQPRSSDSPNGNGTSLSTASTTPLSSPPSYIGSDYFSVQLSQLNTPLPTPATPPCSSPKLELPPPFLQSGLSSPSASRIVLRSVTAADCGPIAALFERAFSTDELRLAIKPPHRINNLDPLEERRWRVRQYKLGTSMPTNHAVMAVDENVGGKVVGAAGFFSPGGYQWLPEAEKLIGEYPSHWDVELKATAAKIIEDTRYGVLQGDFNVWELSQLFVDPDYQRNGIGRMLLEWGLEQADEAGCPMYLEGTPRAKPFYEQMGFTVEAEATFPGVLGEDGKDYRVYCMRRQPVVIQ